MIRLPIRFGDKSKLKSLEVDFLVVDVPTAYNVIIGRSTLHRVKAVVAPDYTLGSPPSSRPSPSDAPASASRGLVASSLAASPSGKGGINSTSSGSRPSAAAHSCSSTKCRPQNTSHPKIRLQGLVRPCGDIQGCRSGPAGSLAPWLGPHQPQPSLADAAALSFRLHGPLGLLATSHSVSDIKRALPAAGTLWRPLTTSTMAISSLETFGGPKAPVATKSQDLTISWMRESLTLGSALMELMEGRGVSEEAPLTTGVTALAPLEGVWCAYLGSAPLMTGSPIGEQTDGRPSPPPPANERMPRSHRGVPRSFAAYGPVSSQRASSRWVQGRALARNSLSLCPKRTNGGRAHRVPAEKERAASLPPAYARQRPPLVREWHPQSRRLSAEPSLDLHKTNRKSVLGRLSTLGEVLKDQKAGRVRRKLLVKNFSLESQFNGSRSLDLLLHFLGPFTSSIA
ncbi:LOW QUALITY PROTEIN: hypothetical protein Cgig2_009863 [Carnegiea gigantea]|uniref:Uncharacterized protein n=1 Tax=Carnegiea gigantea TaxID=171969 RepID=A0A9Q1QLA4_9CARY|nr:LOW QUALITY PROTEIN: hypothetical protein Cgig2_009863 [Carnegiea gigantea]